MLGGFVLDGFIIAGSVLAQAPIKVAKVKTHVLKRHYTTILVSVFVHVVLVILLVFLAEKPQPKPLEITPKAIKSYLYKKPAKRVIVKKAAVQLEEKKVIEKQVALKQDKPKKKVVEKEKPQTELKVNRASAPVYPTASQSEKAKTTTHKPVKAAFSAYKQLDSLRKSINEKMMMQAVAERQQFRSPSVMHGKQIPVPHSNKQLTAEQKREQRITKMSNDISITKYDNGICTIEREQFLGSPVEGSSAAFACGESKFDKSFRAHMKKVQAKLLPVNNK